jgi:hemoglobin
MRTRLLFWSSLAALGLSLVACGAKKPPPKEPAVTETVADAGVEDADAGPPAPKSLFERLGGRDAIAKFVDDFTKNLMANDVTKKRFAKLPKDRLEKFKANMVDQICEAAGGDCTYGGKDMKEAHKGMKITNAEWDATVSALKAALDENEVGENEQSDLIALLAPMKDDIVDPKAKK